MEKDPPAEEDDECRVYRRRWLVLASVSMLNVGINTLLYSYSTVANDAAAYFGREAADINAFTTIGMVASLIVSLFATWLIEKLGLRCGDSTKKGPDRLSYSSNIDSPDTP